MWRAAVSQCTYRFIAIYAPVWQRKKKKKNRHRAKTNFLIHQIFVLTSARIDDKPDSVMMAIDQAGKMMQRLRMKSSIRTSSMSSGISIGARRLPLSEPMHVNTNVHTHTQYYIFIHAHSFFFLRLRLSISVLCVRPAENKLFFSSSPRRKCASVGALKYARIIFTLNQMKICLFLVILFANAHPLNERLRSSDACQWNESNIEMSNTTGQSFGAGIGIVWRWVQNRD